MATPTKPKTSAAAPGSHAAASARSSQLTANSASTTALPSPCTSPTRFARVAPGMANQSIHPNTAASSPPTTPAAIM